MQSNITKSTYPFRLGITLYGVAVAVTCIAAHIWPGVTIINILSLAVIIFCAVFGIRYTPLSSRGAVIVMATSSTLISLGIILNVWYFTTFSGGTPADPVLYNTDAHRAWNDALWRLGDVSATAAHPAHGLFGAVIATWIAIFGQSIAVAIIPCMPLLLGSLILTGMTTLRLGYDRRTAIIAMTATAAVCYWLATGMILLKDAYVIAAVAMAAYSLAGRRSISAVWFTAAVIVLFFVRPNYILFLIAALFIVPRGRDCLTMRFGMAILALFVWSIPHLLEITPSVSSVATSDQATLVHYDEPRQMALYSLIGDYKTLAWYTKIALLPVSVAVQFLIPFPWNYMRDVPFGVSQIWAHFAYCWYVFGGILLYYLARTVKRRTGLTPTLRLTLWGVFCWLVPCYLDGGTISRYGLPAVAVMAPAVAVTLLNSWRSRRFLTAMACWAIVLAAVLIVCHYLQNLYQ